MKNLYLASLLLVASCGQQLVEFGKPQPADMIVSHDLSVVNDLSSMTLMDLSQQQQSDNSVDMSLAQSDSSVDMSVQASDMTLARDMAFPPSPLAACAAMFGSAGQSFAVLGGSTVTNTGSTTTIIGGNVGVSPGSAVVGIPSGMPVGGSIHTADALAAAAQVDLTNVYTCSQAAACDHMLTGTDLGGLRLAPGVYCFTSSAALTGTLLLDANGDPNAIWFFQVASTLTLADNAHVHVIGGGQDCHVFWQVGSSVTMGLGSRLAGNLLAMASITLNTGASISGRALARSGATTMDSNDIVVPACF